MWVFSGGWFSLILMSLVVSTLVIKIMGSEIKSGRTIKIALMNFFLIYLIIVSTSYAHDWYLQQELSSYDLDGDGFFSSEEMTEEQQKAFSKVVHDTGNNLVLLTGGLYSAFVTFLLYIVLKTNQMMRS